MAPTILREHGYRLFFFSREEQRVHVHVSHADGPAKIWMAPSIELAKNRGLDDHQLRTVLRIVHERQAEIVEAWHAHFPA